MINLLMAMVFVSVMVNIGFWFIKINKNIHFYVENMFLILLGVASGLVYFMPDQASTAIYTLAKVHITSDLYFDFSIQIQSIGLLLFMFWLVTKITLNILKYLKTNQIEIFTNLNLVQSVLIFIALQAYNLLTLGIAFQLLLLIYSLKNFGVKKDQNIFALSYSLISVLVWTGSAIVIQGSGAWSLAGIAVHLGAMSEEQILASTIFRGYVLIIIAVLLSFLSLSFKFSKIESFDKLIENFALACVILVSLSFSFFSMVDEGIWWKAILIEIAAWVFLSSFFALTKTKILELFDELLQWPRIVRDSVEETIFNGFKNEGLDSKYNSVETMHINSSQIELIHEREEGSDGPLETSTLVLYLILVFTFFILLSFFGSR